MKTKQLKDLLSSKFVHGLHSEKGNEKHIRCVDLRGGNVIELTALRDDIIKACKGKNFEIQIQMTSVKD